jgi:hypothetical protein
MVAVEVAERRLETPQLTFLKLISPRRHPVDHDLPLQFKSISMACRNGSFLFPVFPSARIPNYRRVSMERSTTSSRIAIRVAVPAASAVEATLCGAIA